jgi:cytosine/uracil/thiamine/allantoin permease
MDTIAVSAFWCGATDTPYRINPKLMDFNKPRWLVGYVAGWAIYLGCCENIT